MEHSRLFTCDPGLANEPGHWVDGSSFLFNKLLLSQVYSVINESSSHLPILKYLSEGEVNKRARIWVWNGSDLGVDLGPPHLLSLSESGWVVVIELLTPTLDFAGQRSPNHSSAVLVSPCDTLLKMTAGGDLQAGRLGGPGLSCARPGNPPLPHGSASSF